MARSGGVSWGIGRLTSWSNVGTGRKTFVILPNVGIPCVAHALDMVDAILHGILRRQELVLRHHILLVRLQVAAGVRLPQVPYCVGFVVPLLVLHHLLPRGFC